MAKKKELKNSEKRILIYLHQVAIPLCYTTRMAAKLDIDYGYLTKILNSMLHKQWIKKKNSMSTNKVFYTRTKYGARILNKHLKEDKECEKNLLTHLI